MTTVTGYTAAQFLTIGEVTTDITVDLVTLNIRALVLLDDIQEVSVIIGQLFINN